MIATALATLLLAGAPPTLEAKPIAKSGELVVRGDKLTGAAEKVALADLLAAPEKHEGKTVCLEGTARKVCSKKGCWMELATGNDEKAAGLRVTFKDYGFFVPLDSAGAAVKLEGTVKLAQLNDAHAKHLEEEGATVQRGKDGKPREVHLIASGVELRR